MALTTFAVLSYRLIFYSTRELSITAMLFCCACSLCVAELVAAAVGNASGVLLSGILPSDILTVLGSNIASGVKLACNHSILSQQARLACCTYTTWFASKNYSEDCYDYDKH